MTNSRRKHGLDLDLDGQISTLELEWQQVYAASILAREEYLFLSARSSTSVMALRRARARLHRAEADSARIMAKIKRFEASVFGEEPGQIHERVHHPSRR
jgi:hypothetical protein